MRLSPRDSRPNEEGQCQHQRARAEVQLGGCAFADRRAVLIGIFTGNGTHWAALTAGHDGFAGIAGAIWASTRTVRATGEYMTGEGDRCERSRISRSVVS